MLEKHIEKVPNNPIAASQTQNMAESQHRSLPGGFILCGAGLLVCILLSIAPLVRIPDKVLRLHISIGTWLATVGGWLPASPGGLTLDVAGILEFLMFMALAFLCYLGAARWVQRQQNEKQQTSLRRWIWGITLLAGAMYVVTPAMLSHDIIVYAAYSRVLGVYHANPYFVPLARFPQDPFVPINYWAATVTAYGPLWTLVSIIPGALLSPQPESYVFFYRLLALIVHLLNIWLIGRTLKTMGGSPRTVTLGMLLYGWNPLVLLESSLGGHNDGFMMLFVISGILLAARAERSQKLLHPQGYLPAIIALTLAVLVKFTALPILAMFILFLAVRAISAVSQPPHIMRQRVICLLQILIPAGLIALLVALVFYLPFWIGHSLKEIAASFQTTPSALYAQNSFMRSLINWTTFHPGSTHNPLISLLLQRHFWDDVNYLVILLMLGWGAWKLWQEPQLRTFILVTLALMTAVLLITPWFYSWYITWLIVPAALCLPIRKNRGEIALLALILTYSYSALWTYAFTNGFLGTRYYLSAFFSIVPAVCAFLAGLLLWRSYHRRRTGAIEE